VIFLHLRLFDAGTPAKTVHLAKAGNIEAFAGLIEANKSQLYRVARGIVFQECDIEDAIQETIFKAWRGLSSLQNDEFFKTWLTRILINECYAILRQRNKTFELGKNVSNHLSETISEEKIDVWNALKVLDYDMRTVIILYYFEDISSKDISKILEVPEGTVKSRLSRAKEKLGKILSIGKGGK
jgi:RNA polymerase sigma-70 factor, ECF subfamily